MHPAAKTETQALEDDLQRLASRAFSFIDWAEDVLHRYHSLISSLQDDTANHLRSLHAWLFVPTTLWPFNIIDVLTDCLGTLEKGEPLGQSQRLLIDLLPPAPNATICAAVADHERYVQKGSYENIVTTQSKFDQTELDIRTDPQMLSQWARLKAEFDMPKYSDHKGVIRRTMGAERNMRPTFAVNLDKPDAVFRAAFDAFCQQWNLYGMQHDEPLLLKLAVNLTPYGTMILIPSYWSFDPRRDIHWDAIAQLHRTRVPGRQGAALAENRAERRKQAETLRQLDLDAKRLKLKGDAKHTFLCNGLGWVLETSHKRISRLRRDFKKQDS